MMIFLKGLKEEKSSLFSFSLFFDRRRALSFLSETNNDSYDWIILVKIITNLLKDQNQSYRILIIFKRISNQTDLVPEFSAEIVYFYVF